MFSKLRFWCKDDSLEAFKAATRDNNAVSMETKNGNASQVKDFMAELIGKDKE